MKLLREWRVLAAAISLLVVFCSSSFADVSLTTSWDRQVKFKVFDAESEEVLSQPLLIIKSEKRTETTAEPIPFYDVIKGSETALIDYRVDAKSPLAEVWAVVPGYKLTTHRILWQELPARQMDGSGLEVNFPTVLLPLKPVGNAKDWQREFRLVIAPELEDLLRLKPPYLSADEHRAISEFLNRERDRMLGL